MIRASLAVLSSSCDGGGGAGDGERGGSVNTTWATSASRRVESISDQTLASYNVFMDYYYYYYLCGIYSENRNWCHYIRAVIHKHNTFVLYRIITENIYIRTVIHKHKNCVFYQVITKKRETSLCRHYKRKKCFFYRVITRTCTHSPPNRSPASNRSMIRCCS